MVDQLATLSSSIPLFSFLECDVISDNTAVILAQKHKVLTLRNITVVRWKNLVTKPGATSWLFNMRDVFGSCPQYGLLTALCTNRITPVLILSHHSKRLSHSIIIKSILNQTEKNLLFIKNILHPSSIFFSFPPLLPVFV